MAQLLEPNATISDALPALADKVEFVRAILGNLMDCKRAHGNANVRIGIAGTAKIPSHKVSYLDPAGEETIFGAYAGKTPTKDDELVRDDAWSNASMSFLEVQALLGELRNFKIAKPARH
ncbi:MAG TPA: hypothetical protein VKQ29_14320 [Aliidongia sp.]|nr:hypothetical protein [Aliidongia sp.]